MHLTTVDAAPLVRRGVITQGGVFIADVTLGTPEADLVEVQVVVIDAKFINCKLQTFKKLD